VNVTPAAHDAGGLTGLDIELTQAMDRLASAWQKRLASGRRSAHF
jgi:pterin-4a-carbinolamine dehydratase